MATSVLCVPIAFSGLCRIVFYLDGNVARTKKAIIDIEHQVVLGIVESLKTDGNFNYTVGEFVVQCYKCFKWRLIPTKDEYETIRPTFIEDPWYCNKNLSVTCDDPGDLECDETRIWMIDNPNIPKPPAGFDKNIILRKVYSKSDSFYATPTGKKVRAPAEVEKFLEANPRYKDAGVSVSSFNFSVPKMMDFHQKAANVTPDGSGKKKEA